jgi:hypothetical protein
VLKITSENFDLKSGLQWATGIKTSRSESISDKWKRLYELATIENDKNGISSFKGKCLTQLYGHPDKFVTGEARFLQRP